MSDFWLELLSLSVILFDNCVIPNVIFWRNNWLLADLRPCVHDWEHLDIEGIQWADKSVLDLVEINVCVERGVKSGLAEDLCVEKVGFQADLEQTADVERELIIGASEIFYQLLYAILIVFVVEFF